MTNPKTMETTPQEFPHVRWMDGNVFVGDHITRDLDPEKLSKLPGAEGSDWEGSITDPDMDAVNICTWNAVSYSPPTKIQTWDEDDNSPTYL